MSKSEFHQQVRELTDQLAGRELNQALQDWLNAEYGPGSETYEQLQQSCRDGVSQGWMCEREAGRIRYGRVFKPEQALRDFSVDVVIMDDCKGPHHSHPTGEIDLLMPLEGEALFDDHAAGWVVYPAGSQHSPTVSNGRAMVMYLLPQGRIEFTQ